MSQTRHQRRLAEARKRSGRPPRERRVDLLRRVAVDVEGMHFDLTGKRGAGTCAVVCALVREGLDQVGIVSEVEAGVLSWWHSTEDVGKRVYELAHAVNVLADGWIVDASFGDQVSACDPRLSSLEGGPMIVRPSGFPIKLGRFVVEWTPHPEFMPDMVARIESVPREWGAWARVVATGGRFPAAAGNLG